MKYLKTHKSFKKVNEELLGSVINFFKNMWNRATEELKKLGQNPSLAELDQWMEKNPFNPSDDSYMLKSVMDEFKKKVTANDQDCITLIDTILNTETGALGKQGLQPFYDQILKAFGNNSASLNVIQYYMERIRDRAIKDYKYAGGPDLKVGVPAKLDPKKVASYDLKDLTVLPDFKKILTAAGTDEKKKRQSAIDWVEKTLVVRLQKYATEVTDQEVNDYLKTKGVTIGGNYKVGDTVIYLRKGVTMDKWTALPDDKKKDITSPEAAKIANSKKIEKIEGDNYTFTGKDGKQIVKTSAEIISKAGEGTEATDSKEAEDLKTKLTTMKDKPEQMKKVASFTDFISKPENDDKYAEIEKIIGAGAPEEA